MISVDMSNGGPVRLVLFFFLYSGGSGAAWAQDSSDESANSGTADVSTDAGPPPSPKLQPGEVHVDQIQPPATDKELAAYAKLIADLKQSVQDAAVSVDQAKAKARTSLQQIRIAQADLRARSMDVRAARQELKVERISDSGAGERKARAALEDAKVREKESRLALAVRLQDQALRKKQLAHAKATRDLEEAKLLEAKVRGELPVAPTEDILKAEKERVRAEAVEARARAAVAGATAQMARIER